MLRLVKKLYKWSVQNGATSTVQMLLASPFVCWWLWHELGDFWKAYWSTLLMILLASSVDYWFWHVFCAGLKRSREDTQKYEEKSEE